jgi:transposase
MPSTKLQNSIDFNGQRFYVGLDVHKKSWAVTVRSLNMQVACFTQPPSAEALVSTLKQKFPGGVFDSAYEAGFCGTTTHELLCKLGVNNMMVHPGDIPSTDKQKKNKTDVHDSRSIAEQLEKKNLHAIHVPTREQQELRSLYRIRESRVKEVTRANNRLKGFLYYFGIEMPESLSKKEELSKRAMNWLSNLEMATEAGTLAKQDLVDELKYQRSKEYQIMKLLRQQIQKNHADGYKRLITVPGIGPITAMALIAEIGDFTRFDNPDEYTSYLGLTPWNDSSGDTIRTKGIQPRCNKHLRPLIIEASWAAIRHTPQLFAYYCKHSTKNNKHAIVKVARKIAMIARGVVIHNQNYNPSYLQEKQDEKSEAKRPKKFSIKLEANENKYTNNIH